MKKILLLFALVLIFTSCSERYTFTESDNGAITRSDGETFLPVENSYRYRDLGVGSKIGAILGADVYSVKGADSLLVAIGETEEYYISEGETFPDTLFEECTEYCYIPKIDLDKRGRISESALKRADKLTGEEAVDFSFYVFYGREPKELGYLNGVYVGEIIGTMETSLPIVSSYPVYKWSSTAYSVEIDGVHYTLEMEWSEKIGIIK